MTFKRWTQRVFGFAVVAVVSFVLLAFLAVQIQQRTLRRRAERLSAEMHQIRLYQSTWADAQGLMKRWGTWGHYEGSCTAESCNYEIQMGTIEYFNPRVRRSAWLDWLLTHDRFNLYHRLGGRGAAFHASFTVRDGTIWRTGSWMGVTVPSRRMRRDNDSDRSLSIGAGSRQRLHRTNENWADFMGSSEDELAQHPFYKVGRPGGCMIDCQIGVVYYSTHTPPAEIERLTSYDFSCFTRFHPCAELEDLLPAAKEWHLYKEDQFQQDSVATEPCDVPVWALARDARYVLSVDALPAEHGKAQVRVVASLKQPAPWLPGATVSASIWPPEEAKHLVPGRRFIVFPIGDDQRDQMVTGDSPLRLDRCGVQDDTPEVRRELEKGFAQNDALRP